MEGALQWPEKDTASSNLVNTVCVLNDRWGSGVLAPESAYVAEQLGWRPRAGLGLLQQRPCAFFMWLLEDGSKIDTLGFLGYSYPLPSSPGSL